MATEVEIKAWVDDPEGLRARVAARYVQKGSYTKEDVYFRLPSTGSGTGPDGPIEFRLRLDNAKAIVTAKRKHVVEGIEVNDEMEYEVSDGPSFERFAEYLGAKVFARKRKVGERYAAGEATIELSHVEGLGDFIEIEWLLEGPSEEEILTARKGVSSLLEGLEIPREKIEPRYYTEMLASLDR